MEHLPNLKMVVEVLPIVVFVEESLLHRLGLVTFEVGKDQSQHVPLKETIAMSW